MAMPCRFHLSLDILYPILVYQQFPVREKRANKSNKHKLYWRVSLVGNAIIGPSDWMGVTFAEQGVAAFVSEQRRVSPPFQSHHGPLTEEAPRP